MKELKQLLDDGYNVWLCKSGNGYIVNVSKRIAVDDDFEYETPVYATIEDAITIAYGNVYDI